MENGQQQLWKAQLQQELQGNILPFWMKHAPDRQNGGFFGAVSNTLQVDNSVERTCVLCARILWTYSKAYSVYRQPEYLEMAEYALDYLLKTFWDAENGGVYWTVDSQGRPLQARKHTYAQAFSIYGLSEFYRATGRIEALEKAQLIFGLLEKNAHDAVYGGYVEGCGADWGPLADMRLSAKEPDCRKSMNTLLHVMEAFSCLSSVWDAPIVRERLAELVNIFLEHIIDVERGCFRLFFDDAWNASGDVISYGHDIEGSWLLVEAADQLGEAALQEKARQAGSLIASQVLAHGVWPDGSVVYERSRSEGANLQRHWWAMAEGMVGFYNAFQISNQPDYVWAAQNCWDILQRYFIDREHGEWLKVLDNAYQPLSNYPKIGPWECPYHHSRACFEMLARLP